MLSNIQRFNIYCFKYVTLDYKIAQPSVVKVKSYRVNRDIWSSILWRDHTDFTIMVEALWSKFSIYKANIKITNYFFVVKAGCGKKNI